MYNCIVFVFILYCIVYCIAYSVWHILYCIVLFLYCIDKYITHSVMCYPSLHGKYTNFYHFCCFCFLYSFVDVSFLYTCRYMLYPPFSLICLSFTCLCCIVCKEFSAWGKITQEITNLHSEHDKSNIMHYETSKIIDVQLRLSCVQFVLKYLNLGFVEGRCSS